MSFSKKFCVLYSLAKRYFLLKTNLKMNKNPLQHSFPNYLSLI